MKAALNFVVTLSALGALLGSAASHATNIAELPLKASVLAKPNVVFAMDDSGSMDAEVMINGTFQGWFYGNYGTAPGGLYPGGLPRTGGATYDWNMLYLFPNGTGSGNKVYADPNAAYGYAIPPTAQVAWTRSSDYNTIYYDSSKTYAPWSPAYVGSSTVSFSDASTTAAKSHPTNGTTTMALNASLTNSAADWKFTFTTSMVIPAGATDVSCLWGASPASPLSADYTVPSSNGLCKATLTYYPATFWKRETCTADGTNCVTNYDGNTLKRYEIKSGVTFPSGRSYAAELQNFANWFTYYRKRRLLLGAAMGDVLENMTGLRLGVVAFNNNAAPTMYDADATAAASNRLAVIGRFYTAEGSGGTPTHTTMAYVRNQFDTNTGIIQYACQRNSMFVITDGFANDAAVAPPTYSQSTYGGSTPYQTTAASSLADKALAYFTLRLRASTSPLPAGRVPVGSLTGENPDPNPDLHLTTYALTLGMKGTLWPTAPNPFTTAPTWPAPVANTATMIDDLWHATINGRGQMYGADNAESTANGVRSALLDILSQSGAQVGVAVSTVNLQRGDSRAYVGTYNTAGWIGDLTANPINTATGAISTTSAWSASSLLTARDWTTRVIATFNGTTGVPFTVANAGATVNPGGVWGDSTQLFNYLRGDRSLEGTTLRARTGLLGALINSEPTVSREDNVVYFASGEGMLHAVDTVTNPGKELWAYVPRAVHGDLGQTAQRGYTFKTQLDGTPVVGRTGASSKLLVAGMGAAGRSYYAIDVSSPRDLTESALASKVKWEFPALGDATTAAKVGQTLGRPLIIKSAADGYVVVVTSGYNNTHDGKGRAWILNPNTGAIVHEFTVADGALGAESGLTHLSPFVEPDGTVRYVFGGDLLGNVWRLDLVGKGAPTKLAVLKDGFGTVQPVTAAPELVYYEGKRIVVVGTGRLLDITDFGSTGVQTMYAISDGSSLPNARSSLVQQTYARAGDTVTANPVNWSSTRGWFMDLPAGEQANTRPTIAYGAVAWTTNVAGASDCSAASYLYVLNVTNGQRFPGAAFVGAQISASANTSGVSALLTTDGRIVGSGQTTEGTPWNREISNPVSIDPSKNAWREVRR